MSGAETGGGRLCVTEEAWQSIYESLGTYFSGQDLCGIFVCEGSCRRFRRQALFQAVRTGEFSRQYGNAPLCSHGGWGGDSLPGYEEKRGKTAGVLLLF